jgi:hypothetical protein
VEGPKGCAAGGSGGREGEPRQGGGERPQRGGDRCGGGVDVVAVALRIRSEVDFATYWAQEERRRNGRGSARRARNARLRTAGAEEHAEKTASNR